MEKMVLLLVLTGMLMPRSDARIWTITFPVGFSGFAYRTDDGYFEGFVKDLVDRVCLEGRMDCRLIVTPISTCWLAGANGAPGSGGRGLLGGWIDACAGYGMIIPRVAVFQFSQSFLQEKNTIFYTLKGKARDFDQSDMAGKVIGFVHNAAHDPSCIRRQTMIKNNAMPDSQIVYVPTRDGLLPLLKSGKVDAVFGSDNYWNSEHFDEIEAVAPGILCVLNGNAMMARKDSAFVAEWNVAFTKLRNRNAFEKVCRELVPKHAHKSLRGLRCKTSNFHN